MHLALCLGVGLYLVVPPRIFAQTTGHALLIGVSKYENSHMNRNPLQFPEADSAALTLLLKSRGYLVQQINGTHATKTSILHALQDLKQKGTAEQTVLVGLFGHGVQYEDVAYFCPYDSQVKEVLDEEGNRMYDKDGTVLLEPAADSLIPLKEFLDTLNVSGAESRVLIADCCREDPNMVRSRAFGSSFAFAVPDGTAVVFACKKGEKAYEHDEWEHGALTRALLDVCENSIETDLNAICAGVSKKVFDLVRTKTNGREQQNVHSIIHGTVRLRGKNSEAPAQNGYGIAMLPIPRDNTVFWIGEHEITQRQWHLIMNTQPSYFSEQGRGARYLSSENPSENRPVENISWQDAMSFCERLTQLEREARRLTDDWQYRLPTEDEWEFVANLNKRQNLHDAEILSKYAWFETNSGHQTHRVGTKESHLESGPKDMLGNVGEFCLDTVVDPEAGERLCLIRGGNFYFPSDQTTTRTKEWALLNQSSNWFGMRIVLAQGRNNEDKSP